jgi:hypothetical protein
MKAHLDDDWEEWEIGDRLVSAQDYHLLPKGQTQEDIITVTETRDGYVWWNDGMTRETNMLRVIAHEI